MIPNLLNIPKNDREWDIWAFNHRDHHRLIRDAIQKQYNRNLIEYQLDPINFNEPESWLERNQQSHNDMNGVLNLQSSDLEGVDFENKSQKAAWIYLHWFEHQSAAIKLGI